MYKKITHTIVEHHYNHPMTLAMANLHPHGTHIKSMATASSAQFGQDVFDAFHDYLVNMRNYLIAILNATPDQSFIASLIVNDITNIINVADGRIDNNTKAALTTFLTAIKENLYNITTALKAGQDITAFESDYNTAVDKFAQVLSTLKPKIWPSATIKDIFTNLNQRWVAQIKSRLSQNWTVDLSALNYASDLMLNAGINQRPGFAEIFASGLS
jgi:hypothetical protein